MNLAPSSQIRESCAPVYCETGLNQIRTPRIKEHAEAETEIVRGQDVPDELVRNVGLDRIRRRRGAESGNLSR
jgi:hypothetical protein